jgi:hypothetical protein
VRFETLFPPMPFAPASLPLAEHVQRLYAEAGGTAKINRVSIGAGTDAAFAALETKAPVIEGMGLRNFGAHSNDAEYVNVSSIDPRLYLLTRLIMDIASGKAGLAVPATITVRFGLRIQDGARRAPVLDTRLAQGCDDHRACGPRAARDTRRRRGSRPQTTPCPEAPPSPEVRVALVTSRERGRLSGPCRASRC